jgi:hypothetical protein
MNDFIKLLLEHEHRFKEVRLGSDYKKMKAFIEEHYSWNTTRVESSLSSTFASVSRFSNIFFASGLMSIRLQFLPRVLHATPVVPLPAVGSNTKSPLFVEIEMIRCRSFRGF